MNAHNSGRRFAISGVQSPQPSAFPAGQPGMSNQRTGQAHPPPSTGQRGRGTAFPGATPPTHALAFSHQPYGPEGHLQTGSQQPATTVFRPSSHLRQTGEKRRQPICLFSWQTRGASAPSIRPGSILPSCLNFLVKVTYTSRATRATSTHSRCGCRLALTRYW